ncbi:DUF4172 domain-containing protein [Fuscibacter oryzae]|uniref:DUF4172 domain-containing protein n=1 Tax=Fuscibacter oryzae TaxID=2803939 RepID=UPI002E28374E|nr:DUF4172 domain-containing protein [Fuscibacter oryzae]
MLESRPPLSSGEVLGAVRHVEQGVRERLQIELLSEEALRTSAIEGEVLDTAQCAILTEFARTFVP